ncbi:MAG: C13 family peptidase [Patescibacteria group bacterium]
MTHGRPFGSGVIGWIGKVFRRLMFAVFVLMLGATCCLGYAIRRGWLQYELHVGDQSETSSPRAEAPSLGTGLGVSGRGRAYGIFVSLWEFPPATDGASRDLSGHRDLARRMADAFIRARIMDPEHAIVLMDEHATPDEFRAAVIRQSIRVTREDLVVVYFGTHGGEHSLELHDHASLTEAELRAHLISLRPGQGLFLADACRSGSLNLAIPTAQETDGAIWHGLYSTSATAPSYGEFMSNALIELVPRLGRDDGVVTMEDLLMAVQDRVRPRLSSEQRTQMDVNALGDGDAMLWRVRLSRIASRD